MKSLIAFTIFLSSLTIMGQEFHTEFKYDDSHNKGITIQNSYPKGGLKYTSPNGKEYVYIVFWTSITNERDSDLELSIDFPNESFIVPSSPNMKFNLYLPSEEMTLEKGPLFNYGLDLKSFLDANIEKPSELVKTISPNESYLFYVIALSNQGVDGVIRAGFELQKQNLIYKINNHEINSGEIKTKK
ncbi:hypothetical protein V8G69_08440 [Gaetbulibacter sp. M235]|uniref:hypothetical protein n=1 Tax=Gaetbulibacter sp. M235 TaxID=3126510 RepID=UPI00374F896E